MILIESKDNNYFKTLKKLKEKRHRVKEGKFLVEGLRIVEEAIKAKAEIEAVVVSRDEEDKFTDILDMIREKCKVVVLSESLFKELGSTENPQGIIAVVSIPKKEKGLKGDFYILLDRIQDPGNLGTIIRTAHAAGADGILLRKGTVDVYNDKSIRSTMGSIFYIPVFEDIDDESLLHYKEEGYKIVVSSLAAENNFFEVNLKEKVIIVVGNEANGVAKEVEDLSDIRVKIPMPGNAESLNAAIAASVMIYEKVRQNLC